MDTNKIMEEFSRKIPGFSEYYQIEKQNLERYNA